MAISSAQQLLKELQALPAIKGATITQDFSAFVNFEYSELDKVLAMVKDELEEVEEAYAHRQQDAEHYFHELGDLLYSLIKLCNWSGISPEEALALSTQKYARRLAFIEEALKKEGKKWGDLKHEELEKYWEQAKQAGL